MTEKKHIKDINHPNIGILISKLLYYFLEYSQTKQRHFVPNDSLFPASAISSNTVLNTFLYHGRTVIILLIFDSDQNMICRIFEWWHLLA